MLIHELDWHLIIYLCVCIKAVIGRPDKKKLQKNDATQMHDKNC